MDADGKFYKFAFASRFYVVKKMQRLSAVDYYRGRCLEELERVFACPYKDMSLQQKILFDSYTINIRELVLYALENKINPVQYVKAIEIPSQKCAKENQKTR